MTADTIHFRRALFGGEKNHSGNGRQDHARPKRPPPKIVLQIGLILCVQCQIGCRQKRKQPQREDAADQREWRQPAREETTHHLTVDKANLTRGQGPKDDALEKRGAKAGDAKHLAPVALGRVRPGVVIAENKS